MMVTALVQIVDPIAKHALPPLVLYATIDFILMGQEIVNLAQETAQFVLSLMDVPIVTKDISSLTIILTPARVAMMLNVWNVLTPQHVHNAKMGITLTPMTLVNHAWITALSAPMELLVMFALKLIM